jgi:hypothetical protein
MSADEVALRLIVGLSLIALAAGISVEYVRSEVRIYRRYRNRRRKT